MSNQFYPNDAPETKKGKVPWDWEEIECLDQLNQHDKGGIITWEKIAKEINKIFHNNRTPEACRRKWSLMNRRRIRSLSE